MAYVIAEPCIGTKDTACVDACPVDCIHPKKDSDKFEKAGEVGRLRRAKRRILRTVAARAQSGRYRAVLVSVSQIFTSEMRTGAVPLWPVKVFISSS